MPTHARAQMDGMEQTNESLLECALRHQAEGIVVTLIDPTHAQDGGRSLTSLALTCSGIYSNPDVQRVLVSIRRVRTVNSGVLTAMRAVAYVHYSPFSNITGPPCEDAEYEGGVPARIMYRALDYNTLDDLPEPPEGTYGTPEEIKREVRALHDENEERGRNHEDAMGLVSTPCDMGFRESP
jgi:hypothetical protein